MLTNDQMRRNRYGQWARARKLINDIQSTLSSGGCVVIATYTRATQYDKRHVDWFKSTKTGAYVMQGKKYVCIDGCAFRFYK